MNSAHEILKQYWGYDGFRPLQLEIIDEIISGRDVLALLPTGGGKSICFQVPAMMMDGICIVISPLIALMKDQVHHLQDRGIKALTITSEHKYDQIDALFDRCIYDKEVKFLYISPERLKTPIARQRIEKMKVCLLAVDEAHCISEWGYDFRPPYLDIAEIRPLMSATPVIALTASATPIVIDDIQKRLQFRSNNVKQKSFARPNLSYFIDWEEDKIGKIERIAKKQGGSGIVYMRSRKGCERLSRTLSQRGVSADFYHAGLDGASRSERQEKWMKSFVQVIVATNAFGMGIDKPDVRFVVHCDLPDTLENYYQECGRAGRDEKKAYAVALLQQKDLDQFREKLVKAFPSRETIVRIYDALGSFLQLAIGSGLGETYAIDIDLFADRTGIDVRTIMLSLKFLEREGYIQVDEGGHHPSTVMVIASDNAVFSLRDKQDDGGKMIDSLLRSYPRLFDESAVISEWTLAKRMGMPKDKIVQLLTWLHETEYISYEPGSSLPRITFTCERLPQKNVRLSAEHYTLRKHVVLEKAQAMLRYAEDSHLCRSRSLLAYFGEKNTMPCGICDVCISNKS